MLRTKSIACDFDGKKVNCNHIVLGTWRCAIPQGKSKNAPKVDKNVSSVSLTPLAIDDYTENRVCKKMGELATGKGWKGSTKKIEVGL